jgi:hypothetical protein
MKLYQSFLLGFWKILYSDSRLALKSYVYEVPSRYEQLTKGDLTEAKAVKTVEEQFKYFTQI